MKKIILVSVLMILSTLVLCQTINYRRFNDTYTDLKKDIIFTQNIKWNEDFRYSIRLPFYFKHDSVVSNEIYFMSNGYVELVDTGAYNSILYTSYFTVLLDRGILLGLNQPKSPASFKIDTVNNELIAKIQWKNAGLEFGGLNDSLNMQIWFFQNSSKVQFRYGKSYIEDFASFIQLDSPAIGMLYETRSLYEIVSLDGNPLNPTFLRNDFGRITGLPPEGMVYEFTPLNSGVTQIKQIQNFTYSIVDKKLNIKFTFANARYKIALVNLLGQEIKYSEINNIDISDVPSGIYLLRILVDGQIYSKKIFIE